ncbi:capsule biosynthesis protein [Cupriavidus necator]
MTISALGDFFSIGGLPVRESVIVVSDSHAALARAREHYSDCSPQVDSAGILGYVFKTWRFLLEAGEGPLRLSIQFASDEADLRHRRMVLEYVLTDPRASDIPVDLPLTEKLAEPVEQAEPVARASASPQRAVTAKMPAKSSRMPSFLRFLSFATLKRSPLFLLAVVLPTVISSIYYGLIASDVYISESKFILRVPQRNGATGLGAIFQGVSLSKVSEDSSVVQEYVKSRDALAILEGKLSLRNAFGSQNADIFSRFPGIFYDDSFEQLYRYFQKHVGIDPGSSSAVSTLRVQAFTSKDAYLINKNMLEMAEGLVNELNNRSRQDSLSYALAEVALAEKKVKAASRALSEFRGKASVFDPDRQSGIQLQLVAKLQDELITKKAQLAQLRLISPKNPQIASLTASIGDLESTIESEKGKVAGEKNSLSNRSVDYERLALERTFAEKLLGSALASLEQARDEAQRKQIYLERVAQPNEPDVAMEPRRIRNVLACLFLGLVAWGILTMLLSGIREHQD